MPAILLLVADGDHNAGGLAALHNRNHLVRLRMPEVRVEEFIPAVFRRLQNRCVPLLRAVYDPVLKLSGNLVKHVPAHWIPLPVRIEETDYSFRLLKRLNQAVEQEPVGASVTESDAIFVMFVKGVHGTLLRVRYQELNAVNASL